MAVALESYFVDWNTYPLSVQPGDPLSINAADPLLAQRPGLAWKPSAK